MRNTGIVGLLAVTVALILLTTSVVYSEDSLRHTPGFPEYLPEYLEDLLRYLSDVLGSRDSRLANLAILLRTRDVGSLASNIESEFPRNLVLNTIEAYASGTLTREDLYNSIQMLEEWYRANMPSGLNITEDLLNGLNVTEDYLLALRALGILASKLGYHDLSGYADTTVYDILYRLLLAWMIVFAGEQAPLTPGLSETGSSAPLELSILSGSGPPLPAFTLPSQLPVPAHVPNVGAHLIGLITAVSLVVLIPLVASRVKPHLANLLSRMTQTSKSLPTLSGSKQPEWQLPRPILLYWVAVDYVTRKYGVRRDTSTTHREFLEVAKPVLEGHRRDHLARLTRVYELVRYGGLHDSFLDEEAEKAYSGLVKD